MRTFIINAIILSVILSNTAYAQNDNDSRNTTSAKQTQSTSIGWDKIIMLVGATGLISAVGSGLFNSYNTNRQLNKQLKNTLTQLGIQQENTFKQIDKQQTNTLTQLGVQLENTIAQMKHERQFNAIQ